MNLDRVHLYHWRLTQVFDEAKISRAQEETTVPRPEMWLITTGDYIDTLLNPMLLASEWFLKLIWSFRGMVEPTYWKGSTYFTLNPSIDAKLFEDSNEGLTDRQIETKHWIQRYAALFGEIRAWGSSIGQYEIFPRYKWINPQLNVFQYACSKWDPHFAVESYLELVSLYEAHVASIRTFPEIRSRSFQSIETSYVDGVQTDEFSNGRDVYRAACLGSNPLRRAFEYVVPGSK
jgi:hypothetical protein